MIKKSKNVGIILLIVTSFLFGIDVGMKYESPSIDESNKKLELNHFFEVWDVINQKYLNKENIANDNAVNYAIKGVVSSLNDPYSMYFTKDESQEFSSSLDSQIQGIGASVTMEDEIITIESPLKSSPAEKAGIQPRDKILAIDGKSTEGMTIKEAVMLIRGEIGSTVTLTIYREEIEKPFEVGIIRDKIELDSVTFELMEDNTMYISINQFSDDTQKEFLAAVSEAVLKDVKGIILDLRYNGGGYLQIAEHIISNFTGPNEIALQVVDSKNNYEIHKTTDKGYLKDIPTVILINEGSASASEIVAGTLQDLDIAQIVGTQSFGKGTVQQLIDFKNGSTLKLTIAKWLTSNARDIDKIGITPDFEIDITETDILNNYDSQLEEAKKVLNTLIN